MIGPKTGVCRECGTDLDAMNERAFSHTTGEATDEQIEEIVFDAIYTHPMQQGLASQNCRGLAKDIVRRIRAALQESKVIRGSNGEREMMAGKRPPAQEGK